MIWIKKLNINFKHEKIYRDFDLHVRKGNKIAFTGESGKGKSTLLNLLAGFIPDFRGEVTVDGIPLNAKNIGIIRRYLAWLPQDTSLNIINVRELFEMPFTFTLNREHFPSEKQISEIFSAFELKEALLDKKVKQISGGQKQRILLASALLQKKPLLLLDEPSSALDIRIKKQVTDYILALPDVTVIAVTHDEYWMSRSDRILNLDEEAVCE